MQINDFAFMVATKNGSGSQTSNNVIVSSLFRMGIPVNGKNLFPSNIKGLPTWYTIRVSKEGYTARRATTRSSGCNGRWAAWGRCSASLATS